MGTPRRVRPAPAGEARIRLRQRSARLPRHARRPSRNVGRASAPSSTGCPNLRLDPEAEPPIPVGFYERGVMEIPGGVRRMSERMTTPIAPDVDPPRRRPHPGVIKRRTGTSAISGTASRRFFSPRPAVAAGNHGPRRSFSPADGDDYLVVASMGGAPEHPLWYAEPPGAPEAEIQVKAEHLPVMARTASPEEKPRLWSIVSEAVAELSTSTRPGPNGSSRSSF